MSGRAAQLRVAPGAGVEHPELAVLLLGSVLLASAIGVVMVASASLGVDRGALHTVTRHAWFLTLAAGTLFMVSAVPLRVWNALHVPILIGTLAALALLLVPGVGREVNGATRWIGVAGFSLQVTEVAKLGFVVFMAGYVSRHAAAVGNGWRALLTPLAALAVLALLLHWLRDYGAAVVIGAVSLGMLFIGGARLRAFLSIALVAVAVLASGALLASYRMQRLTCFLDPWKAANDCGYQLTQALIAFGRGEWWGLGLGQSIQKLAYLPEAHNDFLLAVIGEETGLAGVFGVFLVLAAIVTCMLLIGWRAAQRGHAFGALVSYGGGLVIALQSLISAGVNLGVLPTKGLTLPFVSFGGNSLLVCAALVALALRTDFETRPAAASRLSHPRRRRRAAS